MSVYEWNNALSWWNATAAVAVSGGASVTKAAVAGQAHVVTHISGSGDAAALVTLESPANTVIWRKRFAAAFTFSDPLPAPSYRAGTNTAVVLKISANTTNAEVNIAGFAVQVT